MESCAKANPTAWKAAHRGGPDSDDFIKILAKQIYAIDPRFGLNGKRGSATDISDDALNFKGEGTDTDPDNPRNLTGMVTVIDVIGNAGTDAAVPAWTIVTDVHSPTKARWIDPTIEVAPPVITPPAPAVKLYPYPNEGTDVLAFQNDVKQAYTDARRIFPDPADTDAYRHFVRYGYSCHVMPEPEARRKHISELRAQLGVL